MSYSHLQYESSVYYALSLGNRSFLNLLFYQILLLRPHLTEYVNYLFAHPQKGTFSKFKAIFSCNLALNITIKSDVFLKHLQKKRTARSP